MKKRPKEKKGKNANVHVQVTQELYDKIGELSKQEGRSRKWYVNSAIVQFLLKLQSPKLTITKSDLLKSIKKLPDSFLLDKLIDTLKLEHQKRKKTN